MGYLRRIRTALALLFLPGDRTPVTRQDLADLRREWSTWEVTFSDLLERLTVWAARQARRDKRAIEAALAADPPGASAPTDRRARKLALWRRAAGATPPLSPTIPEDDE